MSDDLHDNQPGGTAPESGWSPAPPTAAPEDNAPRVGFCQDCGKPLTAQTVRTVGTGVFCEPCLAARVAATGGPAGTGAVPPGGAAPIPPPLNPPIATSPVLAGFLGLIPGVGAVYNGQFAKAVAHLVIFVVLKLMEDIASVFGVFVFAWIVYQVFDAYHTAKARLEGLPLPNPFGLNDIGERMGFGRNWPNAGAGTWGSTARPASTASWQTPTPQPPPAAPVPPTSGPDWVGYVPPTHFGGYTPPAYSAPYTPPGHGVPFTPVAPVPYPPVAPISDRNRLPTAAIWLIGLGILILLANSVPHLGISEHWWPPILFAGLAIWILQRRLQRGMNIISAVRAPAILMTLAIFGVVHAISYRVNFGLFFAIICIVIGALLLLERTAGTINTYVPPTTERASFIPAADAVSAQPPVSPADPLTSQGDHGGSR